MKFQPRDGEILWAIYQYDGVLSRRHLKEMFWPEATERAMDKVLLRLVREHYLERPSEEHHKTVAIPEPIFFLGWRGILWIAGQQGIEVKEPSGNNENQMRKVHKRIRDHGIRWLREPNQQLKHDLAVIDFRLAVEKATSEHPTLTLEEWTPESVFRSDKDKVDFEVRGRDGRIKRATRGVIPDSYIELVDQERKKQGDLHTARFLLELDMATHDNPAFGREKVAAGAAYIRSPQYRKRFGNNKGFWLVVTTGEVRMRHLMKQTQKVAGKTASLFFFTTLDQTLEQNPLTAPIWLKVGQNKPAPLIK